MMESAPKRQKLNDAPENHVVTDSASSANLSPSSSRTTDSPSAPSFITALRKSKLPEPTDHEIDRISHATLSRVVKNLKKEITNVQIQEELKPARVDIPEDIPSLLQDALRRNSFHQLYSHQVEIRELVQQKKDVIITTPTSSGKSIGFQVPVLEKFLKSKTSAIYIFPLKALVADQVGKMYQLISKLPPSQRPKVWLVTGDIPEAERERILKSQQPDILICPPDILHWQLFKHWKPGWENWTRFLGRLETVILDEAHSYRGLFGGNMTNLIRRLRGIMDKINPGSSQRLQCIIASATVGNPLSLAQRLLSKQNQPDDIAWINESGAPTNYHVYLTHVAAAFPKRAVAELVDKCIAAGLNGIVFTKTVLAAIELYNYITTAEKKDTQSQGGGNSGTLTFDSIIDQVTPYYASQSATLKANILRDFKEKKKKFLFATSALEAGVDFPETDVCIINGFPASKLSFFQRSGRAGRSGPGLTIFVPNKASGSDFYYTEHPNVLLDQSSIEHIAFNANYPTLLRGHIARYLFEYNAPRTKQQLDDLFQTDTKMILDDLQEKGIVQCSSSGYSFVWGASFPDISFRGGDGGSTSIKVVEESNLSAIWRIRKDAEQAANPAQPKWKRFNNRNQFEDPGVLETVSGIQVFCRLFPGAHFKTLDPSQRGVLYEVTKLEMENGLALLKPVQAVRQTYGQEEERVPCISSSVTLMQNPAVPQRQKIFSVCGRLDATMTVKFSWGQVQESLSGYQIVRKAPPGADGQSRTNDTQAFSYEKPFTTQYEAPAICFEFSEAALTVLRKKAADAYVWMTGQERLKDSKLKEAEMQNHLDRLKREPEFVAIHTLLHQLISVVPLMTMSASEHNSNDVREHSISEKCRFGYLVDSAVGGNGACETLFDNFEFALEMALERTTSCSFCNANERRGFGCAACLYEVGSRCGSDSVGLVASFGVEMLQLAPLKSDTLSQSAELTTTVLDDDETTVFEPASSPNIFDHVEMAAEQILDFLADLISGPQS